MIFLEKFIYNELDPNYKSKWVKPIGILFGILTSGIAYSIIFMFGSFDLFSKTLTYFNSSSERKYFFYTIVLLATFGFAHRIYYSVKSITSHDRKTGIKLTDSYILYVVQSNIVVNIIMYAVYFVIGIIFLLLGYNFKDAFLEAFDFNFLFQKAEYIIAKVPTVIELPYVITLLLAHLIPTLAYYIFHIISHKYRILWLLSHRSHHMTTTLASASVFEADPRIALGVFWNIIMLVLVPGVFSKLFYSNTIFPELILYTIMVGIIQIHSHTSSTYEDIRNNKWLFLVFRFFGGHGPEHILHHSSAPEHAIVNIGGNSVYSFWDRVFGTYELPPKKLPKLGLTNQPEIYLNPLNYALAGTLQILYELKHNSGIVMKLKIIFGNIYFVPPKTKSYLLKNEKQYYASESKVALNS